MMVNPGDLRRTRKANFNWRTKFMRALTYSSVFISQSDGRPFVLRRVQGVGSIRNQLQVYCRNEETLNLLHSSGLRCFVGEGRLPSVCAAERSCSEMNNANRAVWCTYFVLLSYDECHADRVTLPTTPSLLPRP
jgi:hypothetical protein